MIHIYNQSKPKQGKYWTEKKTKAVYHHFKKVCQWVDSKSPSLTLELTDLKTTIQFVRLP